MSIKLFLQSQGFKKYFFNTGWQFVDKALRLVVALFVGIYVARYLGPARFGILNYSISFIALFSILATLGLDGIVVRNLIQNPDKRDILLGTSFGLKIIGSIVLFITVLLVINIISIDFQTKCIILTIAGGMILDSFQVISFYFQSNIQIRFCALASIAAMIISAVVKLFLIFFGAGLYWFAIVIIIEKGVLGAGYIASYIRQHLHISEWKFSKATAKILLNDSWPLILCGMAIMIYMRIDQIMIKEMLGANAVGQYAVATRLSEVWLFVTVAITQSLTPAIIKAKSISEDLYEARLLLLYKFVILLAVIISIIMTLCSRVIVLHLFGMHYIYAANILKIYVWSTIFVYMNNVSWQWYLTENLQKLAFQRLALGAGVNIILNFYLIRIFGTIGAAWSTLISYSIAAYFGNLLSYKTFFNFRLQTKALITFSNITGYKI